jgi:hypothetical protein
MITAIIILIIAMFLVNCMMNLSLYILVLRVAEIADVLDRLTRTDEGDDDGEYYPPNDPTPPNDPDPDAALDWQNDPLYLEFADTISRMANRN